MSVPELDARVLGWLREDAGRPSDWVLASVVAHARRHPRRASWTRGIAARLQPLARRRPASRSLEIALVATLLIVGALLLAVGAGMRPPERSSPTSPSPSPTGTTSVLPIVDRAFDPIGDAAADRDIVAVTTTVDASNVTLVVELREDWSKAADNGWYVAFIEWLADDRPTPVAPGFPHGDCEAWLATYRLLIDRNGTLSGSISPLPEATFEGHRMTIVIPLASLGNPRSLGFAVEMAAPDGDLFPAGSVGTCHYVLGSSPRPVPGH
jgi:hypothetical protein